MFNYQPSQVEESIQKVKQQAQHVEEIADEIRAAVQVVQQGNWLGESDAAFVQDVERLETEVQALRQNLDDFAAHLSLASSLAGEAATTVSSIIANLP